MINLLKSIFTRLSHRPDTRRYPFTVREPMVGSRGHIDIEIDKCIFCGACQKRCPANALAVSRDPKSWTLNPYACIVCGYCVEVCPKKCIIMHAKHFTPAT
jgi:formate hydrogenlyase subunit 6/NADH:ubiquinone oxidoreductase subunit I